MSAQHGRPSRLPPNADLAEALRGRDGHPNHMPLTPSARLPYFEYPRWMDHALCAQVGGDGFYPEKGGPNEPAENAVTVTEAKKVCARCDVRQKCLDYALDNDERFGVWGGLTERERRKLKKAAS